MTNNTLSSWSTTLKDLILTAQFEHLYFIFILIIVYIGYVLIRPIMKWFVAIGSTKLLSYIVNSFVMIGVVFMTMLFIGRIDHTIYSLLKVTFQSLAVFGILLIVTHSWKRIYKKSNV